MSSVTGRIAERAVISNLSIKSWRITRRDKRVKEAACAAYGSDADMVNGTKKLIAEERIKAVYTAEAKAREAHRAMTVPWGDKDRAISVDQVPKCKSTLDKCLDIYDAAVKDFVTYYVDYIAEGQGKLNGLADARDYPPANEIAAHFTFSYGFEPLPVGRDDWRVKASDDVLAYLVAETEKAATERAANALREPAERIREAVARMVESLSGYTGGRKGSFNDSMVDDIRELVDMLPALNLAGDARLAAIGDELKSKLCTLDAEAYRGRDNTLIREVAIEDAQSILAGVDAFLAS